MTRQTLSLDGTWQFQLDPTNSLSLKTLKLKQKVSVPAPWQAHEGLHDYSGVAWYQRSFKLSPKMVGWGRRWCCALARRITLPRCG
ncbi:MAG: hypothetical protein HC853_08455 [Anaerolineae bacterium]|nr:hypothetical protein [Anaerolineae bacterium]